MNTTYFLNQVMGNVFKTKTTPALPQNYYIGLSTTEPSVAGSCVGEVSATGTGYTRILLSNLSEPQNGVIKNESTVSFPKSLANWGVVSHYAVFDSATGGNLLFFDELESPRTMEADTILAFESNAIVLQLLNSDE